MVNGERVAKVAAAGDLLGLDRLLGFFEIYRLGFDFGREVGLESLFIDDRVHLGIVVALCAEDFDDDTFGIFGGVSPVFDLDYDLLPELCLCCFCGVNEDVFIHAAVIRHAEEHLAFLFECADELRLYALYDGDDFARGFAPFVLACMLGLDFVAVEGTFEVSVVDLKVCRFRLSCSDESRNVFFRPCHESGAFGVDGKPSSEFIFHE